MKQEGTPRLFEITYREPALSVTLYKPVMEDTRHHSHVHSHIDLHAWLDVVSLLDFTNHHIDPCISGVMGEGGGKLCRKRLTQFIQQSCRDIGRKPLLDVVIGEQLISQVGPRGSCTEE